MITNQSSEARNAVFGGSAALRHDRIVLLTADALLLSGEKCAPVVVWRSWQVERPMAHLDVAMAGAQLGRMAEGYAATADSKGSKRIDAVQGGRIFDAHVDGITPFPTSLGPPPHCLPV